MTIIEPATQASSQFFKLLLKDCAKGFYQHMYFLGKDVSHPEGNQLQVYGFKKSPSLGLKGTSCYTYRLAQGEIELYGSSAGYYSRGSDVVFIRNLCRFYEWIPDQRLQAGALQKGEVYSPTPSQMFEMLTPLLEWWVTYEGWIESRFGKGYRESCYQEWRKVNKQRSWLPPELAVKWVEQFLEHEVYHVRPKQFIV